jgi:hypothetical protein
MLLLALFTAVSTAETANWTQKSPQTLPQARAGHALAYDSAHGQVVMYGGGVAGFSFDETWVWDGSNWTKKSPQASPPARGGANMTYDSTHGQVVLFGGVSFTSFTDTWVWDGSNWTQKSPQTSPPPRDSHAMVYDSGHGQVVLFGGQNGLNDTWVWSGGGAPAISAVVTAFGVRRILERGAGFVGRDLRIEPCGFHAHLDRRRFQRQ